MEKNIIKYFKDFENETESDWLDFKEKWHDNSAELLKDIICFSNSLSSKKYKYIIFGVKENSKSLQKEYFNIKNDLNRKTEENIQDFLAKNLNYYPKIKLYEIEKDSNIILDILRIESEIDNLPYVVEKEYLEKGKRLIKNAVYIRTGKTSGDIKENASQNLVEKLYRKKFCLDTTPKTKILKYIEDIDNWEEVADGSKRNFYYCFDIKCQIEISQSDRIYLSSIRDGYYDFLFGTYIKENIWDEMTKYNNGRHYSSGDSFRRCYLYIKYDSCIIFSIPLIHIVLNGIYFGEYYCQDYQTSKNEEGLFIQSSFNNNSEQEIKNIILKSQDYKICQLINTVLKYKNNKEFKETLDYLNYDFLKDPYNYKINHFKIK